MDDTSIRAAMKDLRDEIAGAGNGFGVSAEQLVLGPSELDILAWPDNEPVACFRIGLLVGEIRTTGENGWFLQRKLAQATLGRRSAMVRAADR